MVVERRSHHASLTKAKRVLKKEKIRSPNDAWKGYLKTWDQTTQGGFTRPNMNPPAARGQCTDTSWIVAYGHNTQSFMKSAKVL